jgi:hypothetical protein
MPRVRFPGIAIEPATAADGRSGIRLTGEAYIHRSKNLPVSIEAIVVKDDDSPIKTNDPAYKRTHGLYGAGMQVRATDEAYWQQLDLFVPTGPMNLSSGEHRVAVNLRSYRGDRIYCGGTPPTFLTINKAPSATRVGGDPSGAGPPEAGSGPSAPRPAEGRPRRVVSSDSPLAALDPLETGSGQTAGFDIGGRYHLQAAAAKLPALREQQVHEPDAVRRETFKQLSRSLQEARRLYHDSRRPFLGNERPGMERQEPEYPAGFPPPEASPLSFISHLRKAFHRLGRPRVVEALMEQSEGRRRHSRPPCPQRPILRHRLRDEHP